MGNRHVHVALTLVCLGFLAPTLPAAQGIPSAARAGSSATLTQLRVVPDGSSNPPGDVIEMQLCLRGARGDVDVRLRAFLVEKGRQRPVVAQGPANRAGRGRFELRQIVRKPSALRPLALSLVVPYADLRIPEGRHRLGYVVAVSVGGHVVLTQATELTEVTVAAGGRTRMERTTVRDVVVAEKRKVPLLQSDSATRDINAAAPAPAPAPSGSPIEISQYRTKTVTERKDVAVTIPGGFLRNLVAAVAAPKAECGVPAAKPAALPGAQLSQILPADQRQVLFFTNRAQGPTAAQGDPANTKDASSAKTPAVTFVAQAAANLQYGSCVVDIPVKFHHIGDLEGTDWWQPAAPGRAFLIQSTQLLSRDAFFRSASQQDLLVFVHGFNNSFESAILRAAQLAYDLQFPGRAVAFSWPSAGDVLKYEADVGMVDQSASALSEGLWNLLSAAKGNVLGPRRRIHILAHSLGTHVLLEALYELRRDHPEVTETPPFGQIVLAAPDVGAATFNNLLVHAEQSCDQLTYYFCRKDTALKVSQQTNRYEPVGLYPYFDAALATIDADNIDTSFLGHVYFESSPQMLMDMGLVFSQGLRPDRRLPPLAGHETIFGHNYWVFAKPAPPAPSSPPAPPAKVVDGQLPR